jgi:signal transduction histidine kinase
MSSVHNSNINENCDSCGYLVTTIKDTGVGMNPLIREKLFKIFTNFQDGLEDKPFNKTSGIGLGLSISKDLVKALEGSIKIES